MRSAKLHVAALLIVGTSGAGGTVECYQAVHQRQRSRRLRSVRLLFIGAIMGGSISAAHGESSFSQTGAYGPLAYYSYYNYAGVYDGPLGAMTSARNQYELASVPAGYMLALAAIYKNTVLCSATNYATNDLPARELIQSLQGGCGSGYYSSQGITAGWNGGSYSYYYTFPTSEIFD